MCVCVKKEKSRSYINHGGSSLNSFGKSFQWPWVNGPQNLQKQNKHTDWIEELNGTRKFSFPPPKKKKRKAKKKGSFYSRRELQNQTWTCQSSGSLSLEIHKLGSSSGTDVIPSFDLDREGLRIQEIRSIFIKASSCQRETFLINSPNSFHFVAFLQRCSKFIRTSYAAGPSTLQCKSCHGCLGALVPA